MHQIRDTELIKRVGQNLKRIRREKGMTQVALSKESGVPRIQIIRIEKGELNSSISTLYKLSKVLECKIDEFVR